MTTTRGRVRAAAQEAIRNGEPLAWYDRVYAEAAGETSAVPWADLVPNPALVAWGSKEPGASVLAEKRRALVVGCGLGDDAEWLAARGADVVAFDIAPNAIAWCKRRFLASTVAYQVGDLLAPPEAWRGGFDLVFEAYTLQALASELRVRAADQLPTFVAPGGVLVVVGRGADAPARFEDGPPWALARTEIERAGAGLALEAWEDGPDEEGVRRFTGTFRRPR